jgi:hypothetical protein
MLILYINNTVNMYLFMIYLLTLSVNQCVCVGGEVLFHDAVSI